MPKVDIILPNGTKVAVEGSLEEIKDIMEHSDRMAGGVKRAPPRAPAAKPAEVNGDDSTPDIAAIVAKIKDCDEAEVIETRVLDQKDVLNRVLLCLWVVNRDFTDVRRHRKNHRSVGCKGRDLQRLDHPLGPGQGVCLRGHHP